MPKISISKDSHNFLQLAAFVLLMTVIVCYAFMHDPPKFLEFVGMGSFGFLFGAPLVPSREGEHTRATDDEETADEPEPKEND